MLSVVRDPVRTRKSLIWAVVAICVIGPWCPAQAQSINEIVAMALEESPSIKSERLRLDGISEQQVQARNLRRPTLRGDVSAGFAYNGQRVVGQNIWEDTKPVTASLNLSQPLMSGGRYQATLREADLRVAQAIARMRSLELLTVRNALDAYADVVRDWTILGIRDEGLSNLMGQLKATQARKDAGLIGLTDVAQAETRLAAAQGQQASARARLAASWATLERLIGSRPTGLVEVELLPETLPDSLADAISLGIRNSHDIKIARFNEEIARASARTIQTEVAPRASLEASLSGAANSGFQGSRSADAQLSARLVIPLWSAGQNQSRVRAALAEANASRIDSLDLEQQLAERITIAWANLDAADANVTAAAEQVRAAKVARVGAELEQRMGARTTLDVLNQEQEVLDAKVNLANAKREYMVATTLLLTLLGIDPTGRINSDTEFSLERDPKMVLDPPKGRPAFLERPLIALHDRLEPADIFLRNLMGDFQRMIGPEE
ncbi:TolC family protein [Aquidulcibacter sp.]|jgi:TolC family type I secretion outer membrane protein|uniref:TolC family protein n=1 Tax=Aquidulcibacter sp. TaxID=2052990 RepID=UPI003BA4ADED